MKLPLFSFEKVKLRDRKLVSVETAELVSVVLDPFIVTIISIGVILNSVSLSYLGRLWWFGLFILIAVLPTVLYVLISMKTGKIHDWFLSNRAERYKVLAVSLASLLLLNIVVVFGHAPFLFTVFVRSALLQAVVLALITLFWKISFHSSFYTSFASAMMIVFGSRAAWLFLFLPLIWWSRNRLGKHTWGQLVVGAAVAAVTVWGVFWVHGYR